MTQFTFDMPGQPPSWNRSYRITRLKSKTGQVYSTLSKTSVAERYQAGLANVCRSAAPSGFSPAGLVIVSYAFFLARDIDVDNVMKMMNDAISRAIGIDDKRFLLAAHAKQTRVKDPHVTVGIFDADSWSIQIVAR